VQKKVTEKKNIFREFCKDKSVEIVYRNNEFENMPDKFFCSGIDDDYTKDSFLSNKYLLKLEAESDGHLGAVLAFSIYHDHVYIDLLCTNKKPTSAGYSDDGAATILLDFLMKFVDFIRKKYKNNFHLSLTAVGEAVNYYYRKNFNPTEEYVYFKKSKRIFIEDTLVPMQYGGRTDKVKLSKRHRQLKLLRSDGSKAVKRLKNLGVRSKKQQKKLDSILKANKRRSKRLNPLKKYKYKMILIIRWDYEKHFPEKYDLYKA